MAHHCLLSSLRLIESLLLMGKSLVWLKMKRIATIAFLLITLLFSATSCYRLPFRQVDTSGMSRMRAGAPGLNNAEYARRLAADGWPVDSLNTAKKVDYLDDDEKNLILAHNLVRYNPAKFAELYVTEYISYFRGHKFHYPGLRTIMITHEGSRPAADLYRQLLRTEPLQTLYPSRGLTQSAELYIEYLTEHNERGHDGLGGLGSRVSRFGFWRHKIGENISYGNFSPHDALLFLLIDDQVLDRSHRKVILNPEFRYIGTAKGTHPSFPTGFSYVINYADFFTEHLQ